MSKANRYAPEVRERAVRRVVEHEREYPSQWQGICSIAGKIPGTTTEERERTKALEKENKDRAGVEPISAGLGAIRNGQLSTPKQSQCQTTRNACFRPGTITQLLC